MDMGTKRWKDDPRYIVNLIKSYMAGDNATKKNLDRMEKSNQKALNTIEAIYQQVLKDKSEKKGEED